MQIEEVGIIGTGDMGTLEAKAWAKAGFSVSCYDLPQNRDRLERDLAGTGINILDDAIAVVRRSDLTRLLVPVEKIDESVSEWGSSVKKHALVSSGTSVMTPAIMAFEKYLPRDTNIINWHMLAGPAIPLPDMDSGLVNHRSNPEAYQAMRDAIEQLRLRRIIDLPSYQDHDKITADTQAVTHVGFEALGTAWQNMQQYPWENPTYVGGIDNVKVLMCLRIYGGKQHVYSGLALYNPYAKEQIRQYAKSTSDLFGLMIQENEVGFRERIKKAGDFIFNNGDAPILLDDKVMGEFNLGIPAEAGKKNSNLSPLGMVDAWYQAKINPYNNMICQTPVFRLRLGIAEYLFRNKDLLEESIQTAIYNRSIRRDDLEFHKAVWRWCTIVEGGSASVYHQQFMDTQAFLAPRIKEGMQRSAEMIKQLSQAV